MTRPEEVPGVRRNLNDLRLDGMKDADLDAVRSAKAALAERLMCRFQDELNNLPVYYGDEELIDLKLAAEEAISAFRYGAESIAWRRAP